MCVLLIKVPIRKKSGNLFNEPCTWFLVQETHLHSRQTSTRNEQMPTRRTSTWLDEQMKDYIDPKGPKQRTCSKQLQTDNLPTNDVENTNSTNMGKDLQLAHKPWIVHWRIERMPKRIQSHSRITIHRSAHPIWKQEQTEISSYGLDRLQKGIWFGSTKRDNKLSQNVQNITRNYELHRKIMKNWRVELTAGRRSLAETKIKRGIFQGDALLRRLFIIAMLPLNHIFRKCTAGYKLSRSQEKVNHQMYMDDIKLFAKKWKKIWKLSYTPLEYTVRT